MIGQGALHDSVYLTIVAYYVARTLWSCRRTHPDATLVRTPARDSSPIRSNESGDIDQNQEQS